MSQYSVLLVDDEEDVIAGFLLTGMVGILSGCSLRQTREAESIKIGVTVYDQYDTFVSQMMEVFKNYAGEKEAETGIAITIEMYNAADSQTTQNSQVESMINDGCDVVCVNLVD